MALLAVDRHTQVLVTGGAGFIGAHLTRRLLADGVRVTVLTRHVETSRARELASLGATVVRGDLSQEDGIRADVPLPTGALFFHLAADTSVSGPGVWAANVEGTRRALDLAARLDSSYVVYASSIEAQGLAREGEPPLVETAPCHPVSDYGRSKLEAESLVSAWGEQPGRRAAVLRIGNTYGPGSPWLLQSSLLVCLGKASLHAVWEALRHRRFQPLYIDDLVEALIRVAAARIEGVYNVAGTHPLSIEGYLDQLASLLGIREHLKARLKFSAATVLTSQSVAPDFAYFLMGDPERCHRTYDSRKLQLDIGDYGRWTVLRGLASTVSWYRDSGGWQVLMNAVRPQRGPSCTSR